MLEEIIDAKFNEIDLSWTGLNQSEIDAVLANNINPLMNRTKVEFANPGLREFYLFNDPEYIWFVSKFLFNIDLLPIQQVVLETIWTHTFPMYIASRGFGKTFLMGLYALLRAVLSPGINIIVVGAAYRQSRLIFEYAEKIWHGSPVLRSIYRNKRDGPHTHVDRCVFNLGDSKIIAIPIGIRGDKIRGLRANITISDEFNSHDPEIYENVIAGFASVASDPIDSVKKTARRKALRRKGLWTEEEEREYVQQTSNQAVLSGTCGYSFQHFADYWRNYKKIISTRGDNKKLEEIVGRDMLEKGFSWKDYAVIRVPFDLTPPDFLDAKTIARSRATMDSSAFEREFGAVFSRDSSGFFKRSIIDAATTSHTKPLKIGNKKIIFDAAITGAIDGKYVMGVDPASEQDNFAIAIIQLMEDHSRVVYVWTTNRKDFKKRVSKGLTLEFDYYNFCSRKIRDLMRAFPCVGIAIDAQGGGRAIEEALQDPDKLQPGELKLYPVIDPDKEKETDFMDGLHILEMVQFNNAQWTGDANHGMRKDIEDKVLIFPELNPILLGLAIESDKERAELLSRKDTDTFVPYDTLEDCMLEIEELKNELTSIEMIMKGMREHWDTAEVKVSGNKKTTMKKDRYSALLMANMLARTTQRTLPPPVYQFSGGVVGHIKKSRDDRDLYHGPNWWKIPTNIGQVRHEEE